MNSNFWGLTKPPAGTQLDLAHPLCRGLVGAYYFLERSGSRIAELTQGDQPMALSTKLGATLGTAQQGVSGLTCVGNGAGAEVSLPLRLRLKLPITLVCRCYCLGTPTVSAGLFGLLVNNLDASPFWSAALFFNASGSTLSLGWNSSATSGSLAPGTAVHTTPKTLVGTLTAIDRTLYLNGTVLGTVSGAYLNPTYASGALVAFGSYTGNATRNSNLVIDYGLIYNRTLSSTEIGWLSGEPYTLFTPPVWRRYFVPQTPFPPWRQSPMPSLLAQ